MAAGYVMPATLDVELDPKLVHNNVSAVITELVSNSYDAYARSVVVRAPMGRYLTSRAGGVEIDKGFTIEIKDDGTGMTPDQMQAYFLPVGTEHRVDPQREPPSPFPKRRVMGRKGVGKLAPFGICKTIEVISAGTTTRLSDGTAAAGYLTSHLILDYDELKASGFGQSRFYEPTPGDWDQTPSDVSGTTVKLRNFRFRQVPHNDVMARQLAQRFGITRADWKITICDNSKVVEPCREVGELDVTLMPNTKVTFDSESTTQSAIGPDGVAIDGLKAGFGLDDRFYPIRGWIAYSRNRYKDDLMAGVRIYARNGILSPTSEFGNLVASTGEHRLRSHLVGELHLDWLIQTDRRDIPWPNPPIEEFQQWGQEAFGHMGRVAPDPARTAEERIHDQFPGRGQGAIREGAAEVEKILVGRLGQDNAQDISIKAAPHLALNRMGEEIDKSDASTPPKVLHELLSIARTAELSSLGQIAEDRIKVIRRLDKARMEYDAHELQRMIEAAPWLMSHEWTPVAVRPPMGSMALKALVDDRIKPAFVLTCQGRTIRVVEVKRPGYMFTIEEMARLDSYYRCIEAFLDDPKNEVASQEYGDVHITLICDKPEIASDCRSTLNKYEDDDRLTHTDWGTLLVNTERLQKEVLNEVKRQMRFPAGDRETV